MSLNEDILKELNKAKKDPCRECTAETLLLEEHNGFEIRRVYLSDFEINYLLERLPLLK